MKRTAEKQLHRDRISLESLRGYYAENRSFPSFAQMVYLLGMTSTSVVSTFVRRMREAKMLDADDNGRIKPGKHFFDRQVVDTVRAGKPEPANDLEPQGLNIDEYLVEYPSRTVLMVVKGDSMNGVGLMEGDLIVVQTNKLPEVGDIVVMMVDREYTVKTLDRDDNGYFLRAENPAYKEIRANQEMELFGVVTGSFRKMRRGTTATKKKAVGKQQIDTSPARVWPFKTKGESQ